GHQHHQEAQHQGEQDHHLASPTLLPALRKHACSSLASVLPGPSHSRRMTTWPRIWVEPLSRNDDGSHVTALNGTVTVTETESPVLAPETSATELLTFTVVLAEAVGMLAAVSSLLTAVATSGLA